MSRERDERRVASLAQRGDLLGAARLAEDQLRRDPSSTHRQWTFALQAATAGRVDEALAVTERLRGTDAWPHVFGPACDIAMWAGRPDIGVTWFDEWASAIDRREDIASTSLDYIPTVTAYLAHAWAAGRLEEAQRLVDEHRRLDDTGWRTEDGITVRGPAASIVAAGVDPALAALGGSFVSSGRFTEAYDATLSTLFGLAHLDPHAAWNEINRLEQTAPLRPLADPYRAMTVRRGGDDPAFWGWVDRWLDDGLFPMSTHDMVVTGTLRLFLEIRPHWVARRTGPSASP